MAIVVPFDKFATNKSFCELNSVKRTLQSIGARVGAAVGALVRAAAGVSVGVEVGELAGASVGAWVGAFVGVLVVALFGLLEGASVGASVGVLVGAYVGACVGILVGDCVRRNVGACVRELEGAFFGVGTKKEIRSLLIWTNMDKSIGTNVKRFHCYQLVRVAAQHNCSDIGQATRRWIFDNCSIRYIRFKFICLRIV